MINRLYPVGLLLIIASVLVTACGGSSSSEQDPEPEEQTRSFALGFTPWPYDATARAVDFIYSEINSRGDIIAHHLDGGIPWQAALDETAYPDAVEAELGTRVANTAADKLIYLTISPFNGARDNLADDWNNSGTGQALGAPWDSRDFDSPEVIQAYLNFSKNVIDRFSPDYFNFALEASELAINDSTRFDKFVVFAEQVSARLRTDYPNLKLVLSVGLKSPGSSGATIINAEVPKIVPYIDVVGISTYPYVFYDHQDKGDPANLPVDWLSQIKTISAGKPLAITETGWIAERLLIPSFAVDVAASESNQDAYLKLLFDESQQLEMEFIIWFFLVDFDALWSGALGQDDVARIWRDTGLYDENLNPRAALSRWQQQLDIRLAE